MDTYHGDWANKCSGLLMQVSTARTPSEPKWNWAAGDQLSDAVVIPRLLFPAKSTKWSATEWGSSVPQPIPGRFITRDFCSPFRLSVVPHCCWFLDYPCVSGNWPCIWFPDYLLIMRSPYGKSYSTMSCPQRGDISLAAYWVTSGGKGWCVIQTYGVMGLLWELWFLLRPSLGMMQFISSGWHTLWLPT